MSLDNSHWPGQDGSCLTAISLTSVHLAHYDVFTNCVEKQGQKHTRQDHHTQSFHACATITNHTNQKAHTTKQPTTHQKGTNAHDEPIQHTVMTVIRHTKNNRHTDNNQQQSSLDGNENQPLHQSQTNISPATKTTQKHATLHQTTKPSSC